MHNSNMSKCRKYESDKIININIILKYHFNEFKKLKLSRLRNKEMPSG
ncbi:hypothetical protein [Romboutsia maritimum]|nr:hypothetical protein [Romboutsia maritimum]